MSKGTLRTALLALSLERTGSTSLQRQVYDQIRTLILSKQLRGRTKLPSTRILAEDLDCSRNTILAAFEQLIAEGYLESRLGAGTFVAEVLPEEYLKTSVPARSSDAAGESMMLSRRGQQLAALARTERPRYSAFAPSVPEILEFPFDLWHRLYASVWKNPSRSLVSQFDPAGYRPLREAIADYLGTTRMVQCEPDQVVVTTGTQHAIDLAARLLLDPGDSIWIEDPGYMEVRSPLLGAGATIVPVPVDADGISLEDGTRLAPDARMALVTPSHQFPLGLVMSLQRRLDLLAYAAERRMWIIEDDYDSEFRYTSSPIAALQGLDRGERVIYIGTFSKIMFPSLRLGYLVIPKRLVKDFLNARTTLDVQPPISMQPVLAKFIADGHLAAHARRMRAIYQARQRALVEALEENFGDQLAISAKQAGLHIIATFRGDLARRMTDREASRRAADRGLVAKPLSIYGWQHPQEPALLLGYGCIDKDRIPRAVAELRKALS